jgi:hypothetical protein
VYTPRVARADRYQLLLEEIQAEFPGFRVVRKDQSRLHRAIHYGLVAVTLGGMRTYLGSYQTTIGMTVYVTGDWDGRAADDRYVTMRHERVHLRQFQRYGLVGMALLYVLMPLPMGLAYFRARFEMEAYEETIRAAAAIYGVDHVRTAGFRDYIVRQFVSASYGWMWPFRRRVEAWYERTLAALDTALSGTGRDTGGTGA